MSQAPEPDTDEDDEQRVGDEERGVELDDFDALRRVLTPRDPYARSTWLFGRGLGLVFLVAFLSWHAQVLGLIGEAGIVPAIEQLAGHTRAGHGFLEWPTFAWWIGAGDDALIAQCVLGELFAIALLVGGISGPASLACALLYLSTSALGGAFMGFQWDSLLVEAGLVGAFALPWSRPLSLAGRLPAPSRLGRWLIYGLVVRLFLLSGVVKLASGDETWASLTALEYHYWTQPLPNPLSWFVHQLPDALHSVATLLTLVFELVLPFLVLFGVRGRRAAWAGLSLLMVGIGLTGNYGFFNLLGLVLLLPLLDDAALERWGWRRLIERLVPEAPRQRPAALVWLRRAFMVPAAALLMLGLTQLTLGLGGQRAVPDLATEALVAVRPLRVVNSYGLFAVMTQVRREIVIEGSLDGESWREYRFRYKPRDPREAPRWAHLHMPRLDWQMWFAALGPARRSPWIGRLERRLLEGSPEVLALFEDDPFAGERPRVVRARTLDYRFGDVEAWNRDGLYWQVEALSEYGPRAYARDGVAAGHVRTYDRRRREGAER